jgi:hypothetical protein
MAGDVSVFTVDEMVPTMSIPEVTANGAGLAWLPAYTSDGRPPADPWAPQSQDEDSENVSTTVTTTTMTTTGIPQWRV